ncbi:MAG: cellulase family glycosylhydrolase [Treponema sp.]|jgi:hypothetical protein|nr:cellulase family glycosylhydrolase [Treponema sp.]
MRIHEGRILDEQGRTLVLRGVNLGGDSKVPWGPPAWGLRAESLQEPEKVSFVGRPFPLEEAEGRFEQLAGWGFTFIRLLITWEALEHQGPGQYDEAYLAYLRKLLLAAEKWGISVFIDPHQDVWSRFTGGDGAPAWTLEGLGIKPELLDATGAALTWQRYAEYHGGRPCPPMTWPSNYDYYAAATMFTLFFAGTAYAPDIRIGGEPVQDWLQGHYIAAMRHAYRRLKNCRAIVGWGTMNEPGKGFVGHRDLASQEQPTIPLGPVPSPFQTMMAAGGHSVEIPVYGITPLGRRVIRRETLNPRGVSLFREGFDCPWKQAGVWDEQGGSPRLLRGDHFALYRERPPRFADDLLKPFMTKFIAAMEEGRKETLFFIEGIPNGEHPAWHEQDPANTVNAFHWYDGFSLYTRFFRPWFGIDTVTGRPLLGRKALAAYYRKTLGKVLDYAKEKMGNMPCLLGEFGIPYNMNGGRAYRTGNYSTQEEALTFYYDAIDEARLHSTIWNYSATHQAESGDGWNGEDLSIVTTSPDGRLLGRAMAGWLRPYPLATAGIPLAYHWDRKKGVFNFRYRADGNITAPTEIFLPGEYVGPEPEINCAAVVAGSRGDPGEGGGINPRWEYLPAAGRLLVYHEGRGGELVVRVERGGTRVEHH